MFNRKSLLLLSVVALLTISLTTFNSLPTNFSPEWHFCHVPTDSTNNVVAGDYSSTNITVSNETTADAITVSKETTADADTVAIWENTNPFSFKPSPNVYVFYATTDEYACSVIVNIRRLRVQFRTRHRIHVLLSHDVSKVFVTALSGSGATITIRDPPPLAEESIGYYEDCLLKLMAFGLHQLDNTIEKVAVMDADQLILQNLDHVFDLPDTDLAAPRADWIAQDAISSTFMVISLSDRLWEKVRLEMEDIQNNVYDMDLINKMFAKTVLLLPSNYVALNSLWHSNTTPDWYRPEEAQKLEDSTGTEEKKKLQGESFWRALSIMNEDNPFADEKEQSEERQEEDGKAVPKGLKIRRAPEQSTPDPSIPSSDRSPVDDSSPQSSSSGRESESPKEAEQNAKQGSNLETSSTENSSGSSSTRKHIEPLASPSPNRSKHFTPPSDPLQVVYQQNAKILHFTAGGKPWSTTVDQLRLKEPGAHPLYYEQYATWRQEAKNLCPMAPRTKVVPAGDGEGTVSEHYRARIVEHV